MIHEPRLMAYGGPGNDPSQSLVYDVRAILALRDSDPKGATSCRELTGHPAKDLPAGKWGVIPFSSAKAEQWVKKGCLLEVRQTSTGWKVRRVKRRVWEAELGAEAAAWFWAMLESAAWFYEASQPKDEPGVEPAPELAEPGPKVKSKRRRKLEKQRRRMLRQQEREEWA